MRIVLLLALAGLVAGCGSTGFAKPGTEYAEFYNDLTECEDKHTPDSSFCVGIQCSWKNGHIAKRRNQCMMARGWQMTKSGERFVP